MSTLSKATKLSEKRPPLRTCLFGPPGGGKTKLACTAPKPLLLDVEGGAITLDNHPELLAAVDVLQVPNFDTVMDVIFEFREETADSKKYETVVVDTGTELQAILLSDILRKKHSKDENRNPYAAQQLDYKENTEMLRRMIVAFRDLSVNFIIVAHDITDKDGDDGKIYTRPAFTPKLAGTVKGLMDVQAYLTADTDQEGEVVRRLQVHPANNIQAKCRVGGLPVIIEDPHFDMLIRANAEDTQKAETTINTIEKEEAA